MVTMSVSQVHVDYLWKGLSLCSAIRNFVYFSGYTFDSKSPFAKWNIIFMVLQLYYDIIIKPRFLFLSLIYDFNKEMQNYKHVAFTKLVSEFLSLLL